MKTILLLCVLFVASHAKIVPLDLVDEVLEQIQELKNLVQGDILRAHADIQNNEVEFASYSRNVLTNGQLGIQQEAESTVSQLDVLKNLATSAGLDYSSCTDVRESTLERLPRNYLDAMGDCVNFVAQEARRILGGARYIVDIAYSQVTRIEDLAARCEGDLLCLQPLVTEIELSKVRLPQQIRTEVDASQSALDLLKVSVHSCADENESQYVAQASTILADIAACINRLG